MAFNVLGTELEPCSHEPLTGFYRDGCCNTGAEDAGHHIICAIMTEEFLDFSQSVGNDLTTPQPKLNFPGLSPGDSWCLSVGRWQQALEAGVAPPVVLASTHILAIEWVSRIDLVKHAVDANVSVGRETGIRSGAELEEEAGEKSDGEAAAQNGAQSNGEADGVADGESDDKTIGEELDELATDIRDIVSDLKDLKRELGMLERELKEEFGDPDEDSEDYIR